MKQSRLDFPCVSAFSALRSVLALFIFTSVVYAPGTRAAAEAAWLGHWLLNADLTAEAQPENVESRSLLPAGRGRATISVGGIPLPVPGGSAPSASPQSNARDPAVLRCKELTLTRSSDDEIELVFGTIGDDRLRKGTYRGVKTAWSAKQLSSRYQTTERKVTHRYELRDDDRLVVTTTIKAKGQRKRTFKQVFDRVTRSPADGEQAIQ
ncbi:MAG: hypothetical protein AAF648_08460 [Pseudomonadota bacterium]